MGTFEIIGAILMIIISVVITIIVMFQNPKGDGVSALAGGNSFSGGGTKDRSVDAKINRLTKVLATAFFVLTIAVYAFGIYLK